MRMTAVTGFWRYLEQHPLQNFVGRRAVRHGAPVATNRDDVGTVSSSGDDLAQLVGTSAALCPNNLAGRDRGTVARLQFEQGRCRAAVIDGPRLRSAHR